MLGEAAPEQRPVQYRFVKTFGVVRSQQHGLPKGMKEGDEGGHGLVQGDGGNGFILLEEFAITLFEACVKLCVIVDFDPGNHVHIEVVTSADGCQLDDITLLGV